MPKFIYGLIILILAGALAWTFLPMGKDKDKENPTESDSETESDNARKNLPTIILDAGHGGIDPGKVGVNDALEKDINLSIVLKLQKMLKDYGFQIVLTRESDKILGPANSNSPKRDDMIARVDMVKEIEPFFTVSIHQNSFPNPSISGPQVFYYKDSEESAAMALVIQNALTQHLQPPKKRVPQSNTNYYLLTRTPTPTVIVECGFLSNPDEAAMLITDDYQTKLAEAISMGIISYYETTTSEQTPSE